MTTATIPEHIRFSMVLKRSAIRWTLAIPSWLDATVKDFKKHDKARFYQDNFIEQIDFDYLEIQVIEEDGGE